MNKVVHIYPSNFTMSGVCIWSCIFVELIMDRGEKIDNLEGKSQGLVENASMFQKKAKRVRRKYWCANVRNTAILILIALVSAVDACCTGNWEGNLEFFARFALCLFSDGV